MINQLKFIRVEKYVFFLIAILNLLPVLIGKYYPTMDGAAHLYNSNIIIELLFGSNNQFETFFNFNKVLVPNWIGHFILSFFNLFLPAFLAEKILLLTYLIGLPYAFRLLIKTIKPENIEFSYLIFPFCYSFPFILGFYNFSIAIVLMLITLNFWLKTNNTVFSLKKTLIISLLFTLVFFSHVFIFSLVLFFIGLNILYNAFYQSIFNKKEIKILIKEALGKCWLLLIAAFIPLLLFCFYYFSTINSIRHYTFLESQELIEWIKQIRPIIAYNSILESVYTKKIFYIIGALFIISVYERINLLKNSYNLSRKRSFLSENKNILIKSDFWIIATLTICILYFTLPDSDQVAGFFSVRFGLLIFIFLIIWISTQKISKWVIWLSIISIIYFNVRLNNYYATVIKNLNKIAVNCESAAEYIEPNSIVLTINYSDNWLVGHFSNYLGVDKPIVILENYELGTGYFPLQWKDNSIPNLLLDNIDSGKLSCLQWKTNKSNSKKDIEYVFILGEISSEPDTCSQIITNNYVLIYENESCSLYKIKNDKLLLN